MHAATAPAAVANKEMRVNPLYYDRGQQVAHSAGLYFVRVGYFIPLNGPLNGHPPSIYIFNISVLLQSPFSIYECFMHLVRTVLIFVAKFLHKM